MAGPLRIEYPGAVYHITAREKDRISLHKAMHESHIRYGYTFEEIAEYNGVHYSTACKAIRKFVEDPLSWKNK